MIWSIRARLTAWYAGLLSAILVVFGFVLYTLFAQALWAHAEQSLQTLVAQLATFVESSDTGNEQGAFFDLADPSVVGRLSGGGTLIQILDARGRLVNRSPALSGAGLPLTSAVRRALAGTSAFAQATVAGVGPVLMYTAPITRHGAIIGVAQVAATLAPITQPLLRLRWLLLVGGAGALLVAAVVGHLLASIALAPIDRITQTARAIAGGVRGRRINLGGPDDEVQRLAQAFDEMLDRIDEILDRERRFTADAAHELRTPLTILKGELDVALRRERTAAVYRDVLASMAQEVDRLVRLVEDLLTLARADAGPVPIHRTPVTLDAVIRWTQERFGESASQKGITLATDGIVPEIVLGDIDRLRQLFANLVDNALTYTPAGGSVRITATRDAGTTRVAVIDTGCGIAPEDLPHVFERFYRADRARTRASGGSGLGLAIARWIVDVHGGRIDVDSQRGHGTRVNVCLPLAQTSSFGRDREREPDPEPMNGELS
ncbi:MAG TPA: ATP-binding protein [bacterium]|nr:ATP-binding protein [bacterium]